MRIAIHHRKGSFSEQWIDYCKKRNIEYKIVNAFDSDIILQLQGYDIFLWHHHHNDFKDVLTAKRILFALEHAKIKVFPDFKTDWHFDDKVAQKYLLEAIKAPLVQSYVFYDKEEALKWATKTIYPKVFKLKGGAGAQNVKLARNFTEANRLIHKSFGKGFSQFNRFGSLKERLRKYRNGQDTFYSLLKGLGRLFIPTSYARMQSNEKGYAYFQDFIPENNFDTRIIVIGGRAFAITRGVRENDFRASGSGDISYDPSLINIEALKVCFEVNKSINSQSIAFDFVIHNGIPLIVEISYGFATHAYDDCPGYWDSSLVWHEGVFCPQDWMLENLL